MREMLSMLGLLQMRYTMGHDHRQHHGQHQRGSMSEEVKNMIEPSIVAVSIKEGDIVEMIGANLKGEKAKVLRVDEQKGDVVVSLLGALVQLPVTIKIDNVRAVRREDLEEEEQNNDDQTFN